MTRHLAVVTDEESVTKHLVWLLMTTEDESVSCAAAAALLDGADQ